MATTDLPRIAALGEVMVELRQGEDGYRLGYAGDTFNTAVALVREGIETAYATLLGADVFSDGIVELARCEGLATQALLRSEEGRPGLYLIETDAAGQRRFHYWRDNSVARQLLKDEGRVSFLADYLSGFDYLYLSGITLAVIAMPAQAAFWQLLTALHVGGVRLLFDPNWRPALWSDVDLARESYRRVLGLCDISFPTLEDEVALWGVDSPQAALALHSGFGVREVVLKCPDAQAMACVDEETVSARSDYSGEVIDTTGAGDAFNAGYLAARLRGTGLSIALKKAHESAARVVSVRGAIAPRPG